MADVPTQAILSALDVDDVACFGDVNGNAPDLAIALHHRFGADIDLLYLDRSGKFRHATTEERENYLDRLTAAGIDTDRVRFVASKKQARRLDVISCFAGTAPKMSRLARLFGLVLHDNSRCVAEIRKGSGAYPFLRQYGGVNTLRAAHATQLGLAIMSMEPRASPTEDWSGIARQLAGKDGFFTDCGEHSFVYVPRGDTLVVTFDNLDIAMTKREDRRPWGFGFIEAQNWSMLGVMASGWTWFRAEAVEAEFNRLRDEGFFARFKRVVFYGASMGGYAAAAYSAAAKGATVFVISPQSTLDRDTVPWETRYQKAWSRDFSGPYGDAAITSQNAAQLHLMFDPFVSLDAQHAARFTGDNVVRWPCAMLGHRLGSSLQQMGILQKIAASCIEGTLQEQEFRQLLRRRHQFRRYQKELAILAENRGRSDLAERVCDYVLRQHDDRFFRTMRTRLKTGH